jgi:hypothetical protein
MTVDLRSLADRLLDLSAPDAKITIVAATVDQLAQDALTLSDRERAELAHKLLVSLDGVPDERAEEAWDEEIAKRVQKIRDGTAKGRFADEVFRDIQSRSK